MAFGIKKNIGFDRMSITGKFPSGAFFKFAVGRSGETLDLRFSNDRKVLKEQVNIFSKFMNLNEDENNTERFERLENLCKGLKSGGQVIEKMKAALI